MTRQEFIRKTTGTINQNNANQIYAMLCNLVDTAAPADDTKHTLFEAQYKYANEALICIITIKGLFKQQLPDIDDTIPIIIYKDGSIKENTMDGIAKPMLMMMFGMGCIIYFCNGIKKQKKITNEGRLI